jgi:hypothetical protein
MQAGQAVNLSAGVTNGRCPTDNIFIFADAAYCEGDAAISAIPRTDQLNRTNFLRRLNAWTLFPSSDIGGA